MHEKTKTSAYRRTLSIMFISNVVGPPISIEPALTRDAKLDSPSPPHCVSLVFWQRECRIIGNSIQNSTLRSLQKPVSTRLECRMVVAVAAGGAGERDRESVSVCPNKDNVLG